MQAIHPRSLTPNSSNIVQDGIVTVSRTPFSMVLCSSLADHQGSTANGCPEGTHA
jgi:hypothetical protein